MWHRIKDSALKQNGLQQNKECLQVQENRSVPDFRQADAFKEKKTRALTARASRARTLKWTFGWKIFVLYRTEGGISGYCSGTLSSSSKVPPSKGVSAGPCGTTLVGE